MLHSVKTLKVIYALPGLGKTFCCSKFLNLIDYDMLSELEPVDLLASLEDIAEKELIVVSSKPINTNGRMSVQLMGVYFFEDSIEYLKFIRNHGIYTFLSDLEVISMNYYFIQQYQKGKPSERIMYNRMRIGQHLFDKLNFVGKLYDFDSL